MPERIANLGQRLGCATDVHAHGQGRDPRSK
jgi:hypothetical protein